MVSLLFIRISDWNPLLFVQGNVVPIPRASLVQLSTALQDASFLPLRHALCFKAANGAAVIMNKFSLWAFNGRHPMNNNEVLDMNTAVSLHSTLSEACKATAEMNGEIYVDEDPQLWPAFIQKLRRPLQQAKRSYSAAFAAAGPAAAAAAAAALVHAGDGEAGPSSGSSQAVCLDLSKYHISGQNKILFSPEDVSRLLGRPAERDVVSCALEVDGNEYAVAFTKVENKYRLIAKEGATASLPSILRRALGKSENTVSASFAGLGSGKIAIAPSPVKKRKRQQTEEEVRLREALNEARAAVKAAGKKLDDAMEEVLGVVADDLVCGAVAFEDVPASFWEEIKNVRKREELAITIVLKILSHHPERLIQQTREKALADYLLFEFLEPLAGYKLCVQELTHPKNRVQNALFASNCRYYYMDCYLSEMLDTVPLHAALECTEFQFLATPRLFLQSWKSVEIPATFRPVVFGYLQNMFLPRPPPPPPPVEEGGVQENDTQRKEREWQETLWKLRNRLHLTLKDGDQIALFSGFLQAFYVCASSDSDVVTRPLELLYRFVFGSLADMKIDAAEEDSDYFYIQTLNWKSLVRRLKIHRIPSLMEYLRDRARGLIEDYHSAVFDALF